MTSRQTLLDYGMREIASVTLPAPTRFLVELTNQDAGAWERAIYAFLIGDEICRIGSSKGPLNRRLSAWQHDITARLKKMDATEKMATTTEEASLWRQRLEKSGPGVVFARPGTIITTPIGEISAYLDEESVLIGRHSPPMNNSKHR